MQAMTPNDYCRQKAAPPGSALYYSALYLDAKRADALIALYALRAELDEVVSGVSDIEPARAKLAWWRAEIGECFQQRASHPVTKALAHLPVLAGDETRLQELVAGVEADLYQGRYADYAALEHYCRHVSSTLHEVASGILGERNEAVVAFARDIGVVWQLGEFVRNVGRDARAGRLYLPEAELRQFNVSEADIFDRRHNDNVKALLAFQLERIRALRRQALARLTPADRMAPRPLLAALAIQMATLDEIERDGFQVLDRRLSLTPLRKLWIATKIWLRP